MYRYSWTFFRLQSDFACRIARRHALTLGEAIRRFTTIPLSVDLGNVATAIELADRSDRGDVAKVIWDIYRRRNPDKWIELGDTFQGSKLFGCFYYSVHDHEVVRVHFINSLRPDERALDVASVDRRRAELRALFEHVRVHVPEAASVQGNSWLYNLAAYRRLYPPQYTRAMRVAAGDEFNYLALWGQCFDRRWAVRPGQAELLLANVDRSETMYDIAACFPLKVLQPSCSLTHCYDFYDVVR